MFVKVYQYHIQKDKLAEYKKIQEQASKIYDKYIVSETMYLQSKADETKWMEISKYKDENEYNTSIRLINEQQEIQALFNAFQSILVMEKSEITEEDFFERKVKGLI